MGRLNTKLLAIYLQDHLAGTTAAVELSRRAAGSHPGTELGDALQALTLEAINDRQALLDLMAVFQVKPDRVKTTAAWVGEKVGRLKFNGAALLNRSPLSDLVELEGIAIAAQWKAAGWRLLQTLATTDPRLAEANLGDLLHRADDQIVRIEQLRVSIAQDRLTS